VFFEFRFIMSSSWLVGIVGTVLVNNIILWIWGFNDDITFKSGPTLAANDWLGWEWLVALIAKHHFSGLNMLVDREFLVQCHTFLVLSTWWFKDSIIEVLIWLVTAHVRHWNVLLVLLLLLTVLLDLTLDRRRLWFKWRLSVSVWVRLNHHFSSSCIHLLWFSLSLNRHLGTSLTGLNDIATLLLDFMTTTLVCCAGVWRLKAYEHVARSIREAVGWWLILTVRSTRLCLCSVTEFLVMQ